MVVRVILLALLLHAAIAHDADGPEDQVHAVCSKSKLTYEKIFMRHTWRVAGLLDYVDFVNKFSLPLSVSSENIRFENTRFPGRWLFSLTKEKNSQPITLTTTYQYEAITADPEPTVFDVGVTAFIDDASVELPLQISQAAELKGQRQDYKPGVAYQYVFDFVHRFRWENFMSHLTPLVNGRKTTPTSQDIDFQFFITGYVPAPFNSSNMSCLETALLTSSFPNSSEEVRDDSGENAIPAMPTRSKRFYAHGPPFLRHMESMMREDNFTDLTVKSGEEEFQVHKVILASSSPVLANMIKNLSLDKNETTLDLGSDIGADVVEELIRYIYTGKVDTVEEIADRLILAASRFELQYLKHICEVALIQQVRLDNSIAMYTLGKEANSGKLVRRAFTIMKANKSRIAAQPEEFRKLSVHYPNLMFELFLS